MSAAEIESRSRRLAPEPVDVGVVDETRLGRIQLDGFDVFAGDLVLDPLKVAPVVTRLAVVATYRQRDDDAVALANDVDEVAIVLVAVAVGHDQRGECVAVTIATKHPNDRGLVLGRYLDRGRLERCPAGTTTRQEVRRGWCRHRRWSVIARE